MALLDNHQGAQRSQGGMILKARILEILLFIGLSFLISGCSDSTSGEVIIPLESFDPSTINTINWMSKLDDNRKLNEIVLPGSHDSGMSKCVDCSSPAGITCDLSKTQEWDIEHQLHAGTRYFDIRLGYEKGKLISTYHRQSSGDGCDGEDFPHLMEGVARFLKHYPSEFVIFMFSHWRDTPKHYPDAIKVLVDINLTEWEKFFKSITKDPTDPDSKGRELLYKKDVSIYDNILATPVSELRGKIVAVFKNYTIPGQSLYDPSKGRFFYMDIGPYPWEKGPWEKTNFPVYDEYSDTANYHTMKKDQLNKLDTFGGFGSPFLFVFSWTLTPKWYSQLSVIGLASSANKSLPKVLEKEVWPKQKLPNIVYIDLVTTQTNQCIIQYNNDVRTW